MQFWSVMYPDWNAARRIHSCLIIHDEIAIFDWSYWVSAFVRSALGFLCLDPEVYEMIEIK